MDPQKQKCFRLCKMFLRNGQPNTDLFLRAAAAFRLKKLGVLYQVLQYCLLTVSPFIFILLAERLAVGGSGWVLMPSLNGTDPEMHICTP